MVRQRAQPGQLPSPSEDDGLLYIRPGQAQGGGAGRSNRRVQRVTCMGRGTSGPSRGPGRGGEGRRSGSGSRGGCPSVIGFLRAAEGSKVDGFYFRTCREPTFGLVFGSKKKLSPPRIKKKHLVGCPLGLTPPSRGTLPRVTKLSKNISGCHHG